MCGVLRSVRRKAKLGRIRAERLAGLYADARGSTVVEFALIGLLFFSLISFIVQGAFVFNAWLVMTNATQEGARYGALCYGRQVQSCDTSDIVDVVDQTASPTNESQLGVSVSVNNGYITVQTTDQVPIVAPLVNQIFPNPMYISAEAVARLETVTASS